MKERLAEATLFEGGRRWRVATLAGFTASQSCDVEGLRRARGREGARDGLSRLLVKESVREGDAGGFRGDRRLAGGAHLGGKARGSRLPWGDNTGEGRWGSRPGQWALAGLVNRSKAGNGLEKGWEEEEREC